MNDDERGGRSRRIVLVGGGHAHVEVLRAFALRPEPGIRPVLVSRDLLTPYSGMLPGVVAGHYRPPDMHIDLVALAARCDAQLVHGTACGIDRARRILLLTNGQEIDYDLLSLDIGIAPALDGIAGARKHAVAVKPIGDFLAKFDALLAAALRPGGPRRIVMVGGGAGGVELILAIAYRLCAEARGAGLDPGGFTFTLATGGALLATHGNRVRRAFRAILAGKNITLLEHAPVVRIEQRRVVFQDGAAMDADGVLIATGAAAPPWLGDTGLVLDGGFIAVSPTLQSLNDKCIFAAGDCAALVETPREKAGVHAVRAGPPLAGNLRAAARGERLSPWTPQKRHLALISAGDRYAVASRGWIKAQGAWVWRLKDRIDRGWMDRYRS